MSVFRQKGGDTGIEDRWISQAGIQIRQTAPHTSINDLQGRPPKAYKPGRRCKRCGKPLNIYSKNVCNVCLNK